MDALQSYLSELEATGKFVTTAIHWNLVLLRYLQGDDLRPCFFRIYDFIIDSKSRFHELLFPIELPWPRLIIKYSSEDQITEYYTKTIGDVFQIVNARKRGAVIKVEGWPRPRPKFGNASTKAQRNIGIKVTIR